MAFYNYYLRIEAKSKQEADLKMEKFIKVVSEHKEKGFFENLGETLAGFLWEIKKLKEQDSPRPNNNPKPEETKQYQDTSHFNPGIKQINAPQIGDTKKNI